MNPMYYYLTLAMFMSLMWGVFVMMIGILITNGLGQLIESYVKDVQDVVDLRGTINSAGINICPIETAPRNNLFIGDWTIIIGAMLFISGIFTVLYSLTGFVAAIMKSSMVMFLLLLMIIIVCCVEYYVIQVTTDEHDAFHENAQVQMVNLIHKGYVLSRKPNMFTGTLNALMLKTQCCGIRGPADFKNLTFDDGEELVYFSVSPACCKRSVFNAPADEKFSQLKDCARTGHAPLINTPGCYSELFIYLSDNYGTLMVVGVIVLILWQLVQVVLIIMLLFGEHRVAKVAAVNSIPEIRVDRKKRKKPKKFIPHWKTSSYISDDVQRIRSTEIW